jgi:selenocysteine lyase/cysteine desulfurase
VLDELVRYHSQAHRRGPDKQGYFDRAEDVRGRVATLLHCRRTEIAFTKNTSEGLNIAAAGIPFRPGDNVALSQFEHPNNTYAWLALAKRGVDVRVVRPPGHVATAADFIDAMDGHTRAVACSAVSYMPGERLDLAALSQACRERGAYLVVDAVQALGLVDVDVHALGIDILAASGHKGLLAPHGVGVLFCRRDVCLDIRPAFVARSSMKRVQPIESDVREYAYLLQEDARRFEYGNHNYAGISALGAGIDLILSLGIAEIEAHILALSGAMISGLSRLSRYGVRVLTPAEPARRASIVGFTLPNVDDVAAHLRGAGVVFTVRRDAIRFGFGIYNTMAEVARVLGLVEEAVR